MTDVARSCVVVKGKPGMKFDGLIEGTPLEWKIDSGAVNTFMTKEVYYSILPHQRPVLEPARKQFETADGSYLKLLGTARMILTLGDVDVCFRVFVGGVKCNLLGQDFMLRYECQWDYRSDSLILNCVHTSDYEERSCRVVTAENVGVPPRHEAVLKSRVLGGGNTGDGVLVPMKKFVHTHGLAIAHVVVTAKNSDVYVRVFNPGDGEICVKKNTEIALLAPVNFVSEPLHSENVCNVQKLSVSEEIPAFLQEVFDEGCRNLTLEEADKFRQFLIGRKSAFADPEMPAERAKIGEHCINLKDEMPFKEAVRRVPLYKREILDNEIDKLKEQGLIEESKSPWSSPIVLVQKKDKSSRLCVDYRRLNSQTIKDAYPIPRISDDLDALSGSKWFSSLDLNMAYHQIPMREADKEKTAFGTPRGGLYQYQVMPFGLCNAPATFQRVIEQALYGLQWHVTVLYLDDIIVYSRDFDQHLKNLNLVFDRLQDANLKLKAKKCSFFKREVAFLGHIVTEHGVMTDPGKTRAVDEWKTPENVSELRSFLGLVSYYRRFIKNFAHVAKCLHELTSKNVKWEWTTKCDEAFQSLKSELVNAPILGYPDVNGGNFILDTDASNDAIGAVLSQLQDGQEKVIAYASRTLTSAEKNYCVTRKEMLALIFFVKHFKHYLLGREFLLRTDHASLVWLHKFKEPDGQIARWLQQLGPYTFQIQHRVGKRHGNADALTRMSSGDNTCKQCKRDVTKDTSDRIYRNSDELRNTENCEESDKYCAESDKSDICAIDSLFSDISVVTDVLSDDDDIPVTKRSKRKVNRPPRAKSRKTPDESLNLENIRQFQLSDEGIAPILRLKEDPDCQKPPIDSISRQSFEYKFWYSRWDLLSVQNGVLCLRWIESGGETFKICTPRKLRDVVMWQIHDSQTAGHMGIRRTYAKLCKTQYYWPHMRRYVNDYVSSCDVCEERKNPPRKKRSPLKLYVSGNKFERIAVDIAGPFPKSENGYLYILVVADYFTKFTEIYPLRNCDAETVAETIFKGWIKRYGCPRAIHSDQGMQFESRLFQEMCRLLQMNKTRTTPYHPQSDGLVERQNRTIKTALSKYISVHQTDWDKYVDGIVLAYNSTPHETTNISPYRMVFGMEVSIPLDIMTERLDIDDDAQYTNESEYVRKLEDELVLIHEIAREVTGRQSERQKQYYDRNVRQINYDVGDLVRRNQPKVAVGTKAKLARKWTGPWTIIRRLSDVLFQIKHSKHSKPVVVHADNLKPYRGSVRQNSPTQYTEKSRHPDSDHIPAADKTKEPSNDHGLDLGRGSRKLQRRAALKDRPPDKTDQSPPRTTTRHGRVIKKPGRFLD